MKDKRSDKIKVVMNINKELILNMRDRINNGEYDDMTSLIEFAVKNLLYNGSSNEEEVFDLDSLANLEISRHSKWEGKSLKTKIPPMPPLDQKISDVSQSPDLIHQTLHPLIGAENVSEIYIDNYIDSLTIHNPDSALWGQVNRIFPIKACLRVIYGFIADTFVDGYSDIRNFHKRSDIGEYFASVGNMYAEYDKISKRSKGTKISTGFPTGDQYKLEKSIARFISHYCFNIRTDNFVEGALAKMNFIKIIKVDGVGRKIGITEAGYKFAKLHNPVLDGEISDLSNPQLQTLSNEEIDYLLNHFTEFYPAELDTMKQLLNNIADGAITPVGLKNSMEAFLDIGLSRNALGTMVNGLVSRCAELFLLNKKKNGLNVTFHLTQNGKSLIGN